MGFMRFGLGFIRLSCIFFFEAEKDQQYETRWAEGVDKLGGYVRIILWGQATQRGTLCDLLKMFFF